MLRNLINYVKDTDYLIGLYDKYVYIYNYKNIIDISTSSIKIKLDKKYIKINGKDLCVKKLENNEMSIEGEYKEIQFYE